jgi:Yip1 domain
LKINLAERVKAILQNPKSKWPIIEGESHGAGYLFINYAAIFALIPPVAAFIGISFTGYTGYRLNFVRGFVWALIVYALSLVSVFVMAYAIDFLAGLFGGRRNFNNAMKVSVYAPTAAWVASIFDINPPMAFLSLMGLYSFYLLYTGLAALMKPPADKLLIYTIAVVLCAAVLWLVVLGFAATTVGLHLSEFRAMP